MAAKGRDTLRGAEASAAEGDIGSATWSAAWRPPASLSRSSTTSVAPARALAWPRPGSRGVSPTTIARLRQDGAGGDAGTPARGGLMPVGGDERLRRHGASGWCGSEECVWASWPIWAVPSVVPLRAASPASIWRTCPGCAARSQPRGRRSMCWWSRCTRASNRPASRQLARRDRPCGDRRRRRSGDWAHPHVVQRLETYAGSRLPIVWALRVRSERGFVKDGGRGWSAMLVAELAKGERRAWPGGPADRGPAAQNRAIGKGSRILQVDACDTCTPVGTCDNAVHRQYARSRVGQATGQPLASRRGNGSPIVGSRRLCCRRSASRQCGEEVFMSRTSAHRRGFLLLWLV